jgi:hypothetical protein
MLAAMGLRRAVGLLCVGILAGLGNASSGVFPGTSWDTASPASQDLDASVLNAAMAYLADRSGVNGTDEALVVRHGYVVWDGGATDNQHNTWSVTKSFTRRSGWCRWWGR